MKMINTDPTSSSAIAYHFTGISVRELAMAEKHAKEHHMTLKSILAGHSGFGKLSAELEMLCHQARAARRAGCKAPVLLITSLGRITKDGSLAFIAKFLNLLESGLEIHTTFNGRKYTATMLHDAQQWFLVELFLLVSGDRSLTRSLRAKQAAMRKQKFAKSKSPTDARQG